MPLNHGLTWFSGPLRPVRHPVHVDPVRTTQQYRMSLEPRDDDPRDSFRTPESCLPFALCPVPAAYPSPLVVPAPVPVPVPL